MIDLLSLVNFNNQERVRYLPLSWGSFYRRYKVSRHIVLDGSNVMGKQAEIYQKYGIEAHHLPGLSYGERLKAGMNLVRSDYFLFYPDDFKWIFDYPLDTAVEEARRYGVHALKLVPRGKSWYATKNPMPVSWYQGRRVESGELLQPMGDLCVSTRRWVRNFHEQFSLGCNVMNSEFARWVVRKIPKSVKGPSQAEKWAYVLLLLRSRYLVGYYKMWTPAFHFVDLAIEGNTPVTRILAATNLIAENETLFNNLCNGRGEV